MSVTFRCTGVWQLYFSFCQAQIDEVHCKNKWYWSFTHENSTCILVCIFNCIFHGRFCLCDIANLVPIKGWIKYVNLHGPFIIVLAPWNSNDVMAMHDPQVHFFFFWGGGGGSNLFSCIFLLGILIWLHNPLWIIRFACTTTLRDFSILQAITPSILTIDIEICIFQKITVQSTRQEISF